MRAKSTTCGDICVRNVALVRPEAPLNACARLMHDRHVGCLVVTQPGEVNDKPIGVVTDRDIAIKIVAFDLDARTLTAGDVMSAPAYTAGEDDDIMYLLARMREHGVRRMPVVDRSGKLTGIVSADDILELFAQEVDAMLRVIKTEQFREMRGSTTG